MLIEAVADVGDGGNRTIRFGSLDFSGARFTEKVEFHNFSVAGKVALNGANFEGYLSIKDSRFLGLVDVQYAKFEGIVDIYDTSFEDLVLFVDAVFKDQFGLGSVWFNGEALFDRALFEDRVEIGRVKSHSRITFRGARFKEVLTFREIAAKEISLANSTLESRASVDANICLMLAGNARFEHGIDFRLQHAQVDLEGSNFNGPSSIFGGSARDGCFFSRECRRHYLDEDHEDERWMPVLESLARSDASELTLGDVNLRRCIFGGAHHLDKIRFEGQCMFRQPPRKRIGLLPWRWSPRDLILEEQIWRSVQSGKSAENWKIHGLSEWDQPRGVTPAKLSALYRSLRKSLEDGKNEAGAGDFYYGEMEARRRSGRWHDRGLLTAYWVISGYGQRALRALAALVVLIMLTALLLICFGIPGPGPGQTMLATLPPGSVGGSQQFSLEVREQAQALPSFSQRWTLERAGKSVQIALGSVVFRDAGQKLTTAGTWTVMAGRFFGPVLLALAALAIRARVKR